VLLSRRKGGAQEERCELIYDVSSSFWMDSEEFNSTKVKHHFESDTLIAAAALSPKCLRS
jgi:hypothetical protein